MPYSQLCLPQVPSKKSDSTSLSKPLCYSLSSKWVNDDKMQQRKRARYLAHKCPSNTSKRRKTRHNICSRIKARELVFCSERFRIHGKNSKNVRDLCERLDKKMG